VTSASKPTRVGALKMTSFRISTLGIADLQGERACEGFIPLGARGESVPGAVARVRAEGVRWGGAVEGSTGHYT
jgi:hypothetical protein